MLEHDLKVSSWINLLTSAIFICAYKYFFLRKYITYIKILDSFPERQGYIRIAMMKMKARGLLNKLLLVIIAYSLFPNVGSFNTTCGYFNGWSERMCVLNLIYDLTLTDY